MEGGGGAPVSPIAGGARRRKVLAPWRFQSGFVRREMNVGVVSDGKRGGLETLQMSCQTSTSDEPSVSLNDGSGVDGESPATDGEIVVPNNRGGGAVDGENRGLGGVDGNPAAKKGDSLPKDGEFPVDLENDRVTVDPHGMAKPSDLPDFQNNGPAEETNLAVNNSEGFMTSEGTVPGCRKGRKAVVPWRFQIGYQPKWSRDLFSGNRSNGEAEDPTSKVGDGSRKAAPAMACNHSRLKGSATSRRSSVRIPKGTGSAPKKRKVDKDDQYEAMADNRISVVRENVLTTLREFRIVYKKLLEEEQIKWRERGHGLSPDLAAFNIFRERFCANYDDLKYDGSIPGVRIGDVFNSVMELYTVGIHRAQSLAVDHIRKKDGTCLAVSVVSYAQPSAFDSLDFLLHVGSVTDTCDQEMEGTDMALKESMDTDTPVRVIHAVVTELGDDCQPKQLTSYVYGGLYSVEKFNREKTSGSQYVSIFHLRRMAEQQHIDLQVLKTKMPESFAGTFIVDISGGLEKVPISAINSISNEYLITFHYISQIQYPLKYRPDPPSGCDCVGGCSLSQKCACAVKNGGGFHFNDTGGLTEGKPLIYECGPSCKCPPTCRNRVSQHGIKFRLQVFKTKSMGWGVRTLDFIPDGSFVCEYVGELLTDEEAQERKNDEYLFAIGNSYYDAPHWKAEIKAIPSLQNGPSEDDETVFAVDALNQGNFARFINHCCTPNLFPQNVLHDHDNISMPHIMFFASEDIPPLKELSYDYNYQIDKVYDSDGNIKMKECFCGSNECNGRLY
ncbi:histone-lysine N-methyltransferase, H3 lysine-9 specific SUVH5-like [Miscanthus floridulus]|uniref:histone-lysine N-methyltransferase, H3 lysine-9 specific SUVH5-like n=1 Tax=Miscanthus floridulus TaxID=154761 RepID=UPI0034584858